MKSFSGIHLVESSATSKRKALFHSRHLKVHLAARRMGGFPSYLASIKAGRSPSRSSRGKREVEEPRWKFHLVRDTDSHWFLVLASVSGRSQTRWTRKRVLIVREKRNPGGQNVRSKQTPMVVMDERARCPWSRMNSFVWFSKRANAYRSMPERPRNGIDREARIELK
ncbi:unnamed protein product [Lasius platythorax]|uniref:Uncharacterized protein n=1 Tax=Lasius platythorax TaxID=488582 RepID=A0AAV2NX50_9HYME